MKKNILFYIFLILGCADNKKIDNLPNENLVERINSKSFIRSSYTPNLVDEIYEKLEETRPDLKILNENLRELHKQNETPLEEFRIYEKKSSMYYSNAEMISSTIQDSVLKKQMMDILQLSKLRYSQKHADLDALILSFNSQNAKIQDMYQSIKIINTLPLIEQYQMQNLENHQKNYKEMIEKQSIQIKKLEEVMQKK
ncbi:MAG: hypothetical protein OHK0038_12000 [Flammeovirgaceae bacterium]